MLFSTIQHYRKAIMLTCDMFPMDSSLAAKGSWRLGKREAVLLTRLERLIEEAEWTAAKHGVSPHEYVLKKEAPELFVEMRAFIKENGYHGTFLGRVYLIGEIGDYRYWYMSEGSESIILNRALRSTSGVERSDGID